MKGRQAIDVSRIDIGAALQQGEYFVLFAGCTSGEENASRGEFDFTRLGASRRRRLEIRLGLFPALQLLGALVIGRIRTELQRHFCLFLFEIF